MASDQSSFVPSFGELPPSRRSPSSILAAIAIYVTVGALGMLISLATRHAIVLHSYQVTRLIAPTPPPTPAPKFKLPPPPKVQPLKITVPVVQPPPVPPPPAPKPIRVSAPKPKFEAPAPKRVVLAPQVKHVSVFAAARAAINHTQTVAKVNFANAPGAAIHREQRVVRSAVFGAATSRANDPRGRVSSAGFGAAANASDDDPVGHVASVGFGDGSRSSGHENSGRVASAGFGTMEAEHATRKAQAPPSTTSLIILSKPPVAYTEEARAKRIQGDVVLSVTFTASGHVIVHDVVRHLGYGLDKEARRVAQGIRFRPATRGGRPIAVTTEITITFQLT